MKRADRNLLLLVVAGALVLMPLSQPRVVAQSAPPPPQSVPAPETVETPQTPDELQQLVAPIALYPDELVAQILTASEFPVEITEAHQWLRDNASLAPGDVANQVNGESWDPSVKALVQFPPVLENLASNLSWTSALGDAYANQQQAVMDAVQALRRDARKNGTLKSNSQIKVKDDKGYITIEDATPDTVYFPAYDPWLAYGEPIEAWPGWVDVSGCWWDGPGLYFGAGFGIGPYLGFGWGWNAWGLDWSRHGVFFNRAPYFARGPVFFDRGRFYAGKPGFSRGYVPERNAVRGFAPAQSAPARSAPARSAPAKPAPAVRSGPFSGFNSGGAVRGFSARGQQSVGGGFHGGGFSGGGFHGGGGGGGSRGGGRR